MLTVVFCVVLMLLNSEKVGDLKGWLGGLVK
ncbi:hypothetical protein H336_18010 [Vibrio parahaemolyticus EN9701072]|nr:hypothetical protein H336_18010 [Vibrio parahaemolyticus EN9701072]